MPDNAFAPRKTKMMAGEMSASQLEPLFPLEMVYQVGAFTMHLIPGCSGINGWVV